MSVLKLTKNDTTNGNILKLKKSDLYYDASTYSAWEITNRESLNILNDYNNRINKSEWLDEEDRKKYRSALDSYIETSNYLRGVNKMFGEGYTDEDEQKWTDSIASMNSGYDEINSFYSQFASDKVYNNWQASLKADEEYNSYFEKIDAEKGAQGHQKYLDDEKAQRDALIAESENASWWDKASKFILEAAAMTGQMGDTTLPMGTYTTTVNALREDQSYRRPGEDWTEDQLNKFGELYLESPAKAYVFAEETNKRNAKKKEEDAVKKIQENATSGFWSGLGNTVGAIASAPFGLADYLNDLAYAGAGREIAPDGNISPFEYSQAVKGGITTHLNEKGGTLNEDIPIIGGKGWGDVYGLGTSIAQSMASAYTLGGVGTLVSYFGQGAAAGVDDALSRGATDEQALLYGAALGTFEGVAEKMGIDNLFKLGSSATVKGLIKNILSQAGAEGLEEGATAIFSNIADALIMQDKSNFAYQIAEYMNSGMSESDAKWRVFWDSLEGIAFDTISGAVSGSVSGSVQTGIQTSFANAEAKSIYKNEDAVNLVYEALAKNPDNAFAREMKARLDAGKDLTGSQIRRLVEVNSQATKNNPEAQEEAELSTEQTENTFVTENIPEIENATETKIEGSEAIEGAAANVTENAVDSPIAEEERAVTLEEASTKYGAQAQAMVHTYVEGQDVEQYDKAYQIAYDMGRSGVSLSYAMNSQAASYLNEQQRQLAYEAGKSAADISAKDQYAKVKSAATGKTGRKIGTVKGEGVTISDLKKTFNDTQNRAYKILTVAAEATGIDIVLYKSEANANGDFEGAQGKFKWADDKIYIDINAGLKNVKSVDDLAKYAMVRTFSHEFTHFIEKYNSVWYNDFRKVVFEELTTRGENVNDLIEAKMAQNKEMSYEKASREVIAEAMTDILPDAHFVETLANKHKNIIEKVVEKLKEFLSDLKAYFNTIGHNRSREANALKEQVGEAVHYVENIVKLFDKVAVEAVENYQATVAFEEKAEKIDSTVTKKAENISKKAENKANAEKTLFEKYNEVKQNYPDNIVLYRVGDFFEVLGEDAKSVAEWTDTTLTGRNDPNAGRIDMVGFPFHKLEKYVEKIRTHKGVVLVQEEGGVVKEYPMATTESSKDNYKDGGNKNVNRRAETSVSEGESETRETTEDRSRVQSETRKAPERISKARSETDGLRSGGRRVEHPRDFTSDDFVHPAEGTALYDLQREALEDYGLECHIVKESSWGRESEACIYQGEIYAVETIDEDSLKDVIPHEGTHAMRVMNFKPYLDFITRTKAMVDLGSNGAITLLSDVEEHLKNRGIVFADMNKRQEVEFYDEFNAYVYGVVKGGALEDSNSSYSRLVPNAFYDYDAYINELSAIHEQFKAERKAKQQAEAKATEGVGEYADDYELLRTAISNVTRYERGGFLFRIYKNGDTWQGHIDKVNQSEGGYPVSDARGLHYKSEIFNNRADAVEDVIAVARNNKLLDAKTETTETVEVTNEKASEIVTKAEAEPITIEEREKAYKKKFSQWLKKSGRKYVLHYGGVTFLSDGAFGISATDDEIGWARLEFSGMLTETDLPKHSADALDNATTLVTEAPLEGGVGNDSVYVFNVDGKQAVYSKKLLSRLDGNLLYIGDYSGGVKILKAVDAEGNVVGFLLPLRIQSEVTNTKPSKLKSFSNKEVKPNGKNADNRSTARQSDTDRQGDTQVLEGVQTSDVSGDAQRGDSVGDSIERGQETRRDDVRDGSGAGTRSGSGDGDSQSGDIRRDDELTPEAKEKLHEEVTEQIAQQSTELPKGKNFVIGDSLDLPNGEKARYKANIEAIRLVKQLEAEGRYATEAEQAILSKYVGWGGLANAFDERKGDWSKEYKELKELLSEEEYNLARGSTLNAHYTDISVIKAMYDGLAKLGFNGGRMMEPSSGVGNFVGAMPAEMSAKVKSWTMVELDGITGLIAKYLYPNADVRIQGFEKANIPNNYMDVIISNVPFGNYPINDKAYPKKVTSAIHNYFFAKSLDKVRPGGIVMFITSSYTMNSKDETVRRYIMQRADLLGAIRLPDSAFKGNAGTEVVTDILVLKKRAANTAYTGEDFLEAPYKYVNGYNGAYINSYFDAHPEMVLGTASMEGGMYRGNNLTYKALEGKGSLADQIREAFSHIKGKMDYPLQLSPEKTNFAVERAGKKTKADGYVAKDGKIYQNKDGELVEQTVTPKVAERIKGMLEIRDAAKALMNAQQQGLKETEIKKARANLNKIYDAFVKKNGYLNSPSNKSAFNGDPDRYSLFALENWNPEKKTATKADIFSKNTIAPNRTVTSAKDVSEGLIVSVNQTGGVDTALIAKLTGKTEADVTRELLGSRQAFKNRDGMLETAETYLSGNVRAKLRDAEALVPMDSDYEKNVEALKAVMPEDVSYQDIFVNPGTPWIPSSVYSDFAAYMLGSSNTEWRQAVDVTRNAETGNFTVELKNSYLKFNASNTQKWGTSRRSFLDLFDAMLNSKSVVIKDKLEDGSFVVNKDATAAANEKIENITKEFQEWLWKDEARRTELATLYNEVFNSVVTPKYNGDNLTVNGANAMKPLRPHQRNAVQRIISSGGNTLLAHKVGAGKTYEMAAAAMKLKELGLVKKPMFAVPKSLVAQWGNEFIDFFPTAKLLVAEATDFTAANRKVFMNRIANGNYDAVIVSYEQFEKLPVSDDFTRELYQEQINSVIAAIEEAKAEKGGKSLSVKDLEKKRKSLQAKIDKLTDKAKDEGNIDFEELGVDSLFIDEAHNFKNLFYTTSMTNVSGLGNKDGSKRAFDLYTKVRYLQKLNGGKGIVFATATPVMNSMSEMYIMQKYLQPDLLEQLGLNTFDAWAKQFGEVVNGVEIKPSGQGYRVKQSFSRFKNMSELQLLFRNFADVLTDIPGLKIPKMKGGAVNVVVCEPGQFQQDFMKELEKRADNIKNVDPSVDNMLKITSDGRKISYTQRMIDPTLPYEEGCKIYRCADNVVRVYNDSKAVKGTQIVFLDMATPKGKSKTETAETDDETMDMESARLYDDLKSRLVQNGIPAKEIAFIHEADTDQKKKKLFADVNEGKVRVLIGSTGKMGVGMNAQKRIVAIHHLDAPWRPGDVEQRNGRAYRQGNINDEVENFTYVTEGSFDARLWDILERKQNFINQVMNGESVGRETEDTGEVTLSAAEVKALASGSPLILEQVQLDTDIKKLESLYRAHQSSVRAARERLVSDKGKIEVLERKIDLGKSDMLATKDTYSEGKFSITVGKQKFTDKKDAGAALMAEATAKAVDTSYVSIGSFAGFDVRVIKTPEGIKGLIVGKQGYPFNTYPNNTTYMINHLVSVVEGITESVNAWRVALEEIKKDMAEQEKLIEEPFAKQAELDEKRKRYTEVMEILNPKEEQSLDSVAEDTVSEQSREYLDDEQEQQRTDTLTDREVLEMASNEIKVSDLNQAERDALTIFQDRLSNLKDLQDKRAEQGRLYKEQQFGVKPDRAEAEKTLNRMRTLDGQIKKATADVLTVEEKEVLKRVLTKARKVVETQERQHGQEILNRWRDRRNNAEAIKKYRDRLRGDVDELTNWIISPDNKDIAKHVPDVLKNSVIPFLSSINFMSKRSLKGGDATVSDKEFIKRLDALQSAIKINIDVYGMYSGYNDLPPNFMESLENFRKSAQSLLDKSEGEFIINQMTSDELKELSKVVRTLKKYIMQINRFHNNAMYSHVYEAGDNSIDSLKELDNASDKTGAVSNFLFWQQIRPAYAFERFGEGGKAIYDGLRQGQARLAFNTKEIVNFAKNAYTEKEVKAWEDEIKTFSLGNDLVKIPVSHLMSFYELNKDPEAKEHIDGGGIRVATYTRKGKKISDIGHILTVGEFNQLIGSLTDRQREVADSLQKYMAEQGGKWGNYVSVARFGEELFTNKKYFPINSDGRHLSATVDEHPSAAALYALLNMSFTKSRKEGANNRIVLYSIFDVFANHMASMAQYNAMALPILDALKWFNYQQVVINDDGEKFVTGNLREQMARVYGVPEETKPGSGKQGYAETFIVNIIKAFNGTAAQGTPYDTLGLKSLRRYNMAQVAYNFRVALQQPLAITRAGLLVDYKSIIKGMKLKPSAINKNIEEMQKYSGIAAWKSLGFYDVNISRGLTQVIKHDTGVLDKIGNVGMWGAEKADILTWAAIWSAAKEEVISKQHLTPSSEGFYEAVTKLFEDIIYKTQVVDSVLTKNEFMRDKGTFARLVGSFMSEATTNASMLLDAYDKYNLDIKRGMTSRQAWQKNGGKIGRTLYVYGVGAILLAAVQAVADAFRDDDEYEEWGEKWIEAFTGNLVDELMPFNKLPIVADFYDLAKELLSIFGVDTYGNPPQSVFMQWYDSLVKGTEIIYNKIVGENTNYTWYGGIYKLLQAASGISGLPLGSATRELITAWNNTIGAMAPSLRVVTYEATQAETRDALYKAIISGDERERKRIEAEYANQKDIDAALRKALRENDSRIKEAAEAFMKGDYNKYNSLREEIISEGHFSREIVTDALKAEYNYLKKKAEEDK